MRNTQVRWIVWTALIGTLPREVAAKASPTQYDLIDNFNSWLNGGAAYGVDRGQVVGNSPYTRATDGAVIWTSPSQRVNLNPGPGVVAAYPAGYQTSTAFAIYGNQELGQGIAQDHNRHAMLWTGSAASAVDVSITSSGTIIGWAMATDGAQQVGVVSGSIGGDAALWNATGDSFVNLNLSGCDQAYATGVSSGLQIGYGKSAGTAIFRAGTTFQGR